jgi:hypothetical protein
MMVSPSVVDQDLYLAPDLDWIRIQWGPWIRIWIRIRNPDPDSRGQKLPRKI